MISIICLLSLSLVVTAQDNDLPYEEIIGATTVSNVNLRGDPSTNNAAIGTLGQGEQVIILEEIPDGQNVNGIPLWYRVQLSDESEAFIWAGLLTEPEVISRLCTSYVENDYVDSSGWVVNHGSVWLHEFNVSKGAIEQIRVRTTTDTWKLSVSLDELTTELALPITMTTDNYIDEQNCRMTGAIVVTQEDGDSYVPVRNVENGEIRFLSIRVVTWVYYQETLIADLLDQASESGNPNEDLTPDTIENSFEYSDSYGGYIRDVGNFTVVYRRFLDRPTIAGGIDGESAIMSEIVYPELGTITFEQIHNMTALNISQRPQARFNDNAEEVIPDGLRTFFLLAYQNAYSVSEEEAEELLAINTPLPLSWEAEFRTHSQGPQHVLSNSSAHVRYYRPQSGVSFVVIDQGFDIIPGPPNTLQQFPGLAIVFQGGTGLPGPGYTYGLDVEANGRLVIYKYVPYVDSYHDSFSYGLRISSHIITGMFDAYKFTVDIQTNPTRLGISNAYHANWNDIRPGSAQEQIRMAFGFPSVEDYAELSNQVSELSVDERREYFIDQLIFDVTLP
jgi:hypothetical protein